MHESEIETTTSSWRGKLREMGLGLVLAAAGFVIVSEGLSRAEATARSADAWSSAVREGDRLLERLRLELAQTDSSRMLPNGVSLQKTSAVVTYTWNAKSGQVRRTEEGGAPEVIAHGISAFAVATNPDGQVVLTVEARRGSEAAHRRTVRLTAGTPG